jgi:hypothetical protein
MADIVPSYSFNTPELPAPQQVATPDTTQGVHITVQPEQLEWILEKITGWFSDRDEIILIDAGLSDKQGLGQIILEWDGYEIDPLFIAILRDEEIVIDFCVYATGEA